MNDLNKPAPSEQLMPEQEEPPVARNLPRLRFPFICLVGFWALTFAATTVNKPYFVGFMIGLALGGLLTLSFLGWWWFNRSLRLWEKTAGFALLIGEAALVAKLSDRSITPFTLWAVGLPLAASIIVAWLFLVKKFKLPCLRTGFAALTMLGWCYFLVIRIDGADAKLNFSTHWRWTPTSEERFLAQAQARPQSARERTPEAALPAPEFRGPNRDGVIVGSRIGTNWVTNPPSLVWKRAVGPAWSSLLVVGNNLFTQEQRGSNEVVVCYDAAKGDPLWVHEDAARFDESVSGSGPRATPTFAQGRLYTLGGTGLLNCLDAATGRVVWHTDIKGPSGAKIPMWAFSGSPLVAGDLVIVYAGGEAGKGLLAYQSDTGTLAWTAAAGVSSYSSPQLTTLSGISQCLMLHDGGLLSVDIATGKKLWETGIAMKGAPRCGQPRLINDNNLLVAALGGLGCSLIEVSTNANGWSVLDKWDSKDLKPEFPDFVVRDGYAYGFDIGVFCCLNLADGKRTWKEGRYGRGEVMLLRDQGLLLVSSETGELALLVADPGAHKQLAQFQALQGKTWNHPVVRADRVYLRNAQEMACYSIVANQPKLTQR
jgi:outer membrane protein assembly factor BamB